MAALTFLQTLKDEVGRMQAAHPEREAELARACALIAHGMVVQSPDDPATGQVLASDMQTVYHVNGTCDCTAGAYGRDCKHQHAWKLYKHVERKLAQLMAQPAAPVALPEEMEVYPDNDPEDVQAPQDDDITGGNTAPVPTSPALPEAPASVNCHITVAGRQVQLTLRDTDEARLLARLQAVLARYPVEQTAQPQTQLSPQQHNAAAMHKKITGFCQVHGAPMKLNDKRGRQWWSHRTADGQWCKGR